MHRARHRMQGKQCGRSKDLADSIKGNCVFVASHVLHMHVEYSVMI